MGRDDSIRKLLSELHANESRRIFAYLVRRFGDFDLSEEALQEAFAAAIEQWQTEGIPENPRGWLVSVARFKAIDSVRRKARFDASMVELARRVGRAEFEANEPDDATLRDDHLRLIFTCCHPALSQNAQIALTLREVCGLTTEEVASAFLSSPATIAQRIVRGKSKIRNARIPYEVPSTADLPERLEAILAVIYLVFNEGYSASSGESATRPDLSAEAIRLGRILSELLPDPEVLGLVALMLLHDSRRSARLTADGDLILLEDQDRSLWNREQIADGAKLVERAISSRRFGAYTVQAAIAAVHAESPSAEETDWTQIGALYDVLLQLSPSPIVELNRAVAIAMRDGADAGLELIDAILSRGALVDYHLAHAARADLCRRSGRISDAITSYEKALALAGQEPERRFLRMRLNELKQ